MSSGRAWTPREDEGLLTMYAEGKTYHVIARSLGRAMTSISSRLITLNVPLRRAGRAKDIAPAPPPGSSHSRKDIKAGGRGEQKLRNCLCCRKTFMSAHAGNRLCNKCRTIDVSPYALAL